MLLLTFPERQDTLSRVGSGGPRYEQKWPMTYTNWPRQTPAFRDSQSNTLTQPYTPQTLSPKKTHRVGETKTGRSQGLCMGRHCPLVAVLVISLSGLEQVPRTIMGAQPQEPGTPRQDKALKCPWG